MLKLLNFISFLTLELIILLSQSHAFARELSQLNSAIITSGGVSLGSYKAGFLYRLTQHLGKENSLDNTSILAGASAGSINSLLAIDSLCNPQEEKLDENLFYKAWIPVGINELFSPEEVQSTSIFHRRNAEKVLSALKERFRKGYSRSCKKILIIPITRTRIFNTIKNKRAFTPGLRNFVIIKVTGNGENNPVSFENIILKTNSNDQVALAFSNDFNENFEIIKKTIFASTAFPVAFSPVKINVCENLELACTNELSVEHEFIDGGVFDNAPLGLSNELLAQEKIPLKNRSFYLIDSSNDSFKNIFEKGKNKADNLSSMLFSYLDNLIQVARHSEEKRLLVNNVDIIGHVKNISTILPPVSSPLNAFMGFYDINFRKFDFYMAYFDASYLLKYLYPNSVKNESLNLEYQNLANCFSLLRTPQESSKLKESYVSKEAICRESILKIDPNLKILMQLSLVRAFYFCKSEEGTSRFNQGHCKYHNSLEAPLDLIGLDAYINLSAFKNDIDNINIILDFLDFYKYQYHDLNVKFSNQKTGKAKVYESTRVIFEEIRKHQFIQDSAIVGVAQTLALNNLEYIPPQKTINVNIGTAFEIGANYGITFITPYLSATASLYFHEFESFLGNQNERLAILPNIGLLYSPSILRIPEYDIGFSFGAGYGYQIAKATNKSIYKEKECDLQKYAQSATNCSGAAAILYSSINLFDRINLKLGFNIYEKKNHDKHPRKGFIMFGYQFF